MYHLITKHLDQLLGSIRPNKDINPYAELIRTFRNKNVSTDEPFQELYKDYWKLNPARLLDTFHSRYFTFMQQCKVDDVKPAVRKVAQELYPTPTHQKRKGTRYTFQHTLQFSFSSKLVHML